MEDNDSTDWGSLCEIPLTTEDSDTSDTDETERLDDIFYQNAHTL